MSVWDTIKGSVAPGGAARNFALDATGARNFTQAFQSAKQGDWGTAFRQGGAGALKAGSFVIPGGLAARGAISAGLGARALAGGLIYGAGETLGGGLQTQQKSTPLNMPSMYGQADVDRNQRIAREQARSAYLQRQLDSQQQAQSMQDQMAQNIDRSFTEEQRTALQNMNIDRNAIWGSGAAESQDPAYDEPDWLSSMKGLSPTQAWDFERRGFEADEAFKRLSEQADFERERGQLSTRARLRQASRAGAGSASDLQAQLARRGLGTSAATAGVGRDFIYGRAAQERAAERGAFRELEASITRRLSQAGAERESYLSQLGDQRQAQMQENQRAYEAARAQDRENWRRTMGLA